MGDDRINSDDMRYVPHAQLSSCSSQCFHVGLQDGNAYLFVVSANDKQWSKSQSKLRKLQESFRA